MLDTPDQELLRRYAEEGSDEAFGELVGRHCNLVWEAARRISNDGEAARDIAQTVFSDLARKARHLRAGTVLPGWLYRAASHTAANYVRNETRRARREVHAMQQSELQTSDSDDQRAAEELQPLLDSALAELNRSDREVLVLRFLSGRSLAEIGAAFGTNADAAQKRVSRALERLRTVFQKRGVAVNGGIVAAALGVAGSKAAPVGIAASLAGNALAGVGAGAGAASLLLFMKLKIAAGIAGGLVIATGILWHERQLARYVRENDALRRQLDAFNTSQAQAGAQKTLDAENLARMDREHDELVRLRGEVSRLRQLSRERASSDIRANPIKSEASSPAYSSVGAANPSAALERLALASSLGDAASISKFVTWRIGDGVPDQVVNGMREGMKRNLTNTLNGNGKLHIVNQLAESDSLVRARVGWMDHDGKENFAELRFALEEGEWKPAFSIERSPSGSFGATLFTPTTPELGP